MTHHVVIRAPRSYVEVLGIRTAYWRSGGGRGRTLVLMHGSSPGACTELNWFRNFDALADMGFDVIGFDQPGFGQSEAPTDHSIEFRYRHAEAFLRAMHVETCVLVGNSMGGLLAVLLDNRIDPGEIRVEGLVLAAQVPHFELSEDLRERMAAHRKRLGSIEPSFEGVRKLTSNTLYNHAFLTDELVRLRLSMITGRNLAAFRARAAGSDDFDSALVRSKPVPTPTLVVWGLNDRSLVPEIGVEAMKHFDNARFLFVPHCGHWPQTEHTQAFHMNLVGFVNEIRPAAANADDPVRALATH